MSERADVLLATYQGENFIEAQIESILRQTYPHFQIIIRDDGSQDATKPILRKIQQRHPQKIQLIEGEQLGIVKNFEQLLKMSVSPYVFLSDQDDIWLPDKMAFTMQCAKAMEKVHGKEKPLLIHTDLCVVDGELLPLARSFWKYAKLNPNPHFNRLLVQNSVTGCTCLINRPLINLLREFPCEVSSHDSWMALLAAAFGNIGALSTPTVWYRQHTSNALGAKSMSLKAYLHRAWQFWRNPDPSPWHMRYEQAKAFYKLYANQLLPNQKEALEAFLKAPQCHWLTRKYLFLRHQFFWMGTLRNFTKFFLPYPF